MILPSIPTAETVHAITRILLKHDVPSATVLAILDDLERMIEEEMAKAKTQHQEMTRLMGLYAGDMK